MNRKTWTIGMLVLLLALSTGCGQKPEASPANDPVASGSEGTGTETVQTGSAAAGETNTVPEKTEPPVQSETDRTVKKTIETYYTDDQMLDLKKTSAEISYKDEAEKYLSALQTLKTSGNSALFPLWGKVEFHTAKLENGQLTVDITLPDEARLGAGGEVLALDALKQTMFQFPEVESIELLVDGNQVDTLMGHEELEHPMTRN